MTEVILVYNFLKFLTERRYGFPADSFYHVSLGNVAIQERIVFGF